MLTEKEIRYEEWRKLMIAAQSGNKSAYTKLLNELYPALLGFISGRSGPDEAEDIVQDILVSVHKARDTYDPEKSFASWLFAIARYKLIDFYRKTNRAGQLNEKLQEDFGQEGTNSDNDTEEKLEQLHEMISRLPEKQQKIIRYLKLENLSVRETAKITGMSESAVKVTAHRGYNNLKKYRSEAGEN